MSDKLTVGKITFASPSVSIKQRGVRVVKRDQRTLDEKLAAFERSAVGMMHQLRALFPKQYDSLVEKSFDTANDSP